MRTLEIELPDEVMNRLEEMAHERGIDVQTLVVQILEEALRVEQLSQESPQR